MEETQETVVYLPGVDGTGELIYRQVDLQANYRVLCQHYPDDREQTYQTLAESAIERIEADSDGQPVTILAESFGGAVALTLALMRPDLVERMLLVNTFAYYPGRFLINWARIFGRYLPARPVFPGTRFFRGRYFFPPGLTKSERNEWWSRTDCVSMRAYWVRMSLIADLDLRDRLSEVDCPTLILCSPNDKLVDPSAGRELARLLPHARIIERPVAHAAMIHPSINIADLLSDRGLWIAPAVDGDAGD